MTTIIKMEVELAPFTTPNFVTVKLPPSDGSSRHLEPSTYALHEISEAILERLCEEFRTNVLEKARKERKVLQSKGIEEKIR
ncbi:MAG TPA: hypothetical protein PLR83_00210 [Pyrinomonadaceae bacterium]|nr:hypothetical protein [Pyrinomonadaceae bacterium]